MKGCDYPNARARTLTLLTGVPKKILCYYYYFIILSGARLSPVGTAANTGLLYQLQMIDDGDCGAIGGMKIGTGNRSTRRKPAPGPLCPPQINMTRPGLDPGTPR
jgi:hypothetical protein